MNRLTGMVSALCPDGIPHVSMGSLMNRSREKAKSDNSISQVYVVSNTQGMVRAEDYRINTMHSEDTSNYTIIRDGMVAYNPSRLNIGSIAMLNSDVPGLVSPMYVVFSIDEKKIHRRYFEYLTKSSFVSNRINAFKEEGARFRFDYSRWNWIKIPLPPLELQQEIIDILSKFEQLSSGLREELENREIQLKEYIEILLDRKHFISFQDIKMSDLFSFKNGLSKGKDYFGSGTPIVRYTDVYNKRFLYKADIDALVTCTDKELSNLKVDKGDVFFTRTSEIADEVGYSSVMLDEIEDCVFNGFTIKAHPKTDKLLPEYCAFCFSTMEFRNYVTSHCAFTTRASLTGKAIGEYTLPVPEKEEQEKIVKCLMPMYKICYDIGEGLMAEIDEREKQFRFYRDKLLSFDDYPIKE